MSRKKISSFEIEVIRQRGDRLYKTALEFLEIVRSILKDKELNTNEIAEHFPGVLLLRIYDSMIELEEIGAVKCTRNRGKKSKKRKWGVPNRWKLINEDYFK